jgi:hypothetical protein
VVSVDVTPLVVEEDASALEALDLGYLAAGGGDFVEVAGDLLPRTAACSAFGLRALHLPLTSGSGEVLARARPASGGVWRRCLESCATKAGCRPARELARLRPRAPWGRSRFTTTNRLVNTSPAAQQSVSLCASPRDRRGPGLRKDAHVPRQLRRRTAVDDSSLARALRWKGAQPGSAPAARSPSCKASPN